MKYERIARRVEGAIQRGALRAGERLPSLRQQADQDGVSIATVLRAYGHLENSGLLETRPQSGHYVRARAALATEEPRVASVASSATSVRISRLLSQLSGTGDAASVVPLGDAVPDLSLLPVVQLERLLVQVARERGGRALAYAPPAGLLPLREQLARRSVDWGCPLSAEEFVITNGASEAVSLCLQVVARRGDIVAVESPSYHGTLQAIEALGLRAADIPSHPSGGMQLDALESALASLPVRAVVAVTNASNPLGATMPDAGKERLVRMVSRCGVALIEDDVWGDLVFGRGRPVVAKAFDREDAVLLCGSFSKALAPGFRVGWVAAGRARERLELLKYAHTGANATAPQVVLAHFLQRGGYERHLRVLRRQIATQIERTREAVARSFPTGTRMTRPTGGCVLWVELPRGVDATELQSRALGLGIRVAPGPIFSSRRRFTRCVRINCGNPWSGRIEAAVATLGRLAQELAAARRLRSA